MKAVSTKPKQESMIVYKYLHPNRVGVLTDGLIRFTQAAALNDPFESTPIGTSLFKSLVERQRELVKQSRFKLEGMDKVEVEAFIIKKAREVEGGIREQARQNYGILSVSLERSELLMWSHYCDSHRGFVVGFEGLHEYFQRGIPDKRGGLREIRYTETRPVLPPMEDFHTQNVAEILLFSKSPHWRYERELRMLHNLKHADLRIEPEAGGDTVYLFKFPVETVREIILGCRMSDSLRQKIVTVAKEKYPLARIFQAKVSDTEFKIVIEEV